MNARKNHQGQKEKQKIMGKEEGSSICMQELMTPAPRETLLCWEMGEFFKGEKIRLIYAYLIQREKGNMKGTIKGTKMQVSKKI